MAAIYFHIPFCKTKCFYCNFYSVTTSELKYNYILALKKELIARKSYINEETVKSIYFGGGTPSVIDIKELNSLIILVADKMELSKEAEITLEINPDDVTADFITELKKSAFNRVSLGIQSFFDKDLEYLGRRHNAEKAHKALEMLLSNGYLNISADLIYGMPVLPDKNLEQNLEILVNYKIPHISAYALTLEKDSVLDKQIRQKKAKKINENTVKRQFYIVMDYLCSKGYLHYETSNFAIPGYFSRHNSLYWQGGIYLGLGASAHSYNKYSRQANPADIDKYISDINNNKFSYETETLDDNQKFNEYIMLSLRTMWGCNARYIFLAFGADKYEHFKKYILRYIDEKLVECNGDIYNLTKKGKILADLIASDLFIV
ncbi:MAG: radical SAM family heme chaperone HemW [Bacteroidales bacterium]|nr:radical SAM family heme chaperone HemW [Bacteroidales bacterium]